MFAISKVADLKYFFSRRSTVQKFPLLLVFPDQCYKTFLSQSASFYSYAFGSFRKKNHNELPKVAERTIILPIRSPWHHFCSIFCLPYRASLSKSEHVFEQVWTCFCTTVLNLFLRPKFGTDWQNLSKLVKSRNQVQHGATIFGLTTLCIMAKLRHSA